MQQEGVYQWRFASDEKTAYLHAADSDSTDNIGSIAFKCEIHSGEVDIEARIDKTNKSNFSKLISRDIYPRIELSEQKSDEAGVLLENISYSELYGWQYGFKMPNEDKNLDKFEKSGFLKFLIGGVYSDSINLRVGLEEITQFRQMCRKNDSNSKSK